MAQAMTASPPLVTAEDLAKMPRDGVRRELVRGEMVEVAPAFSDHSEMALTIGAALKRHAAALQLGRVTGADGGFIIARDPDTLRAPDAAFVSREKLAALPHACAEVAPDLVVEVVSSADRPGEVLATVGDWLDAGTAVVWVVWPEHRRVDVYRPGEPVGIVEQGETLRCEELLPGFALPVAEIFA